MTAKIVHLRRPRTFTSSEAVLDAIREKMFTSHLTQKQIAAGANISPATVGHIMTGHTRWPRPTTLFPIMQVLGIRLYIE